MSTNPMIQRFNELANLAGIGPAGQFSVVSESTIGGPTYVIGRTDDVALAVFAAKMLDIREAVPCERIVAR